MTEKDDYPAMNERQNALLQSGPDDAGQNAQPTHYGFDSASAADKSHVLTIDELPKHDDGYESFDMTKFLSDSDYGSTPPEKHWYESKVIWFNAIVVAVGLATSATPALEQYMSAEMYGVIASFVAFINAVLRLVTGQPIKKGGV